MKTSRVKEYWLKKENDTAYLSLSKLIIKRKKVILEPPLEIFNYAKPKLTNVGYDIELYLKPGKSGRKYSVDVQGYKASYKQFLIKVVDEEKVSNYYDYYKVKTCYVDITSKELTKYQLTILSNKEYKLLDKHYEQTQYALEYFA